MKLPDALLRDAAYRKAAKLCNTISEKRFELADLAYTLRIENYRVDCGAEGVCTWSHIIAAAEGIALRTAEERAQVGEFCARHKQKTKRYSRVSSAVRYCGVIDDSELVAMMDDDDAYPTVQSLQKALWLVAYGTKEFTPIIITRSLSRMGNAGASLLGLNGQLPEDIRAHVTLATAEIGQALDKMRERTK